MYNGLSLSFLCFRVCFDRFRFWFSCDALCCCGSQSSQPFLARFMYVFPLSLYTCTRICILTILCLFVVVVRWGGIMCPCLRSLIMISIIADCTLRSCFSFIFVLCFPFIFFCFEEEGGGCGGLLIFGASVSSCGRRCRIFDSSSEAAASMHMRVHVDVRRCICVGKRTFTYSSVSS